MEEYNCDKAQFNSLFLYKKKSKTQAKKENPQLLRSITQKHTSAHSKNHAA